MEDFADAIIDWHKTHGRHDLPWQSDPSPYRVWVSEIMLQQTRVGTVIPYFQRFMARFPDIESLAHADIDRVLHLWTGLGYYARARNLHKAARTIMAEHGGRLPATVEELESLSGIGRSTAGAVLCLGHGRPAPILDGNVKRVLARCFAVEGYPGDSKTRAELWALAERLLPQNAAENRPGGGCGRAAAYTQGMMDLGATLCTRANPDCPRCPLRRRCLARQRGEIDRHPGKKAAKALPLRSVAMFILQNDDGRVLLEKRPPSGVWGSLYSLPQADLPQPRSQSQPRAKIAASPASGAAGSSRKPAAPPPPGPAIGLRYHDEPPVELPGIKHSFTHFQLDIVPILYRVGGADTILAESDRWLWYAIDNPAEVGLAAPVRKLLASLAPSPRQPTGTTMTRTVHCRKYGRELPGLPAPPYPGDKGREIHDTVSQRAWREWLAQQTMLINEKQLSLANAADRKYLGEQMEKFLDNQDFDRATGYVPPD